ncbi:class GN sortase [Aurantivibrio plasticivorans]
MRKTDVCSRHIFRWTSMLALIVSIVAFCQASYLESKAWLSQQLLERAWQSTQPGKPWPWADITPAAKLTIPKLGVEQIVLAGFSGEALAFGPGVESIGSAHLIAGHRDSHFEFLRHLEIGDKLYLETLDGKETSYQISSTAIIDTLQHPTIQPAQDTVILSTCYPFDEWQGGGSRRYLVIAERNSLTASVNETLNF